LELKIKSARFSISKISYFWEMQGFFMEVNFRLWLFPAHSQTIRVRVYWVEILCRSNFISTQNFNFLRLSAKVCGSTQDWLEFMQFLSNYTVSHKHPTTTQLKCWSLKTQSGIISPKVSLWKFTAWLLSCQDYFHEFATDITNIFSWKSCLRFT